MTGTSGTTQAQRGGRRRRSGTILIYSLASLVALLGVGSLAVDAGRVVLVKTELAAAADAAARAAVSGLKDGTYVAKAQAVAAQNNADGTPVALTAADVEPGTWDTATGSFVAADPSVANAVRVTTCRTTARGNPVPLAVARALGAMTCDVRASSVANSPPTADPYGIVGVRSFKAQGLFLTDSFPVSNHGDVVSDGDIKLNLLGLIGLTRIAGDARPGVSRSINGPLIKGTTIITGSTTSLDKSLYYPAVPADTGTVDNDNALLPSAQFDGTDLGVLIGAHLPGGTYRVRNLNVLAGVILTLDGPATFYVTGNVTMAGSILVQGSKAANFRVRVIGTGSVVLAANLALFLDLYAPESPVTVLAGLGYFGRLVGRDVDVIGTSLVWYDQTLGPPETADGSPKLVR